MATGQPANRIGRADSMRSAIETIEMYYEKGWTDGLPVIPPTEEGVLEMLAAVDRDPLEILGQVPPRTGEATVEAIAVNALMAGCRPEYLPVVLAAVEAILEKPFNLNGVQATTHCCAPLAIISGPAVKRLNINSGTNVFGHGFRANATIGRAIRLIMVNLGGGYPETADKATLGHPGKYTFCIGESPESPWEPLHVERGLRTEDSGVTMFACEAPHSVFSGALGEGMLWAIADCLATVGNNNAGFGGQTCVVISPLQAERLSQKGWSKGDVKHFLYEKARVPLSQLRAVWRQELEGGPARDGERWPRWLEASEEAALVPVVRRPENIHVVVAGGCGVGFCAVLPGWGFMGGYAVTKPIAPASPRHPGG